MKKANIPTNVFFYIFFAIVIVWILFFGLKNILFIDETLTERDKMLIKVEMKQAFEKCLDPLNRGRYEILEFNHRSFNGVCILRENYLDTIRVGNPVEWDSIKQGGHNVVLVSTIFNSTNYPISYNVIDSFSLDFELPSSPSNNHICWYDFENTGRVEMKILCE